MDEGKPWEIVWGELRWEGAIWKNSMWGELRWEVDGGETARNSLGRAPVGRSDTGVTRWWTVGKHGE